MTISNEIINLQQAEFLATVRELGNPTTSQAIMAAAGLSRSRFQHLRETLDERGLIAVEIAKRVKAGGGNLLISITPLGSRALAADKVRRAEIGSGLRVPPPTRCVVVPILPVPPFYRNAGNRHIPSRGVAC